MEWASRSVENAILVQLISHWPITKMMCPIRHKRDVEFPLRFVIYFFKKSVQILLYTTLAKRNIILVFIGHSVLEKINCLT